MPVALLETISVEHPGRARKDHKVFIETWLILNLGFVVAQGLFRVTGFRPAGSPGRYLVQKRGGIVINGPGVLVISRSCLVAHWCQRRPDEVVGEEPAATCLARWGCFGSLCSCDRPFGVHILIFVLYSWRVRSRGYWLASWCALLLDLLLFLLAVSLVEPLPAALGSGFWALDSGLWALLFDVLVTYHRFLSISDLLSPLGFLGHFSRLSL